jgi:hypothetical protein
MIDIAKHIAKHQIPHDEVEQQVQWLIHFNETYGNSAPTISDTNYMNILVDNPELIDKLTVFWQSRVVQKLFLHAHKIEWERPCAENLLYLMWKINDLKNPNWVPRIDDIVLAKRRSGIITSEGHAIIQNTRLLLADIGGSSIARQSTFIIKKFLIV